MFAGHYISGPLPPRERRCVFRRKIFDRHQPIKNHNCRMLHKGEDGEGANWRLAARPPAVLARRLTRAAVGRAVGRLTVRPHHGHCAPGAALLDRHPAALFSRRSHGRRQFRKCLWLMNWQVFLNDCCASKSASNASLSEFSPACW